MKATTKRAWWVMDHSTGEHVKIQPGTYELERIPNPYGHEGNWLVIKGSTLGAAEGFWRDFPKGSQKSDPPSDAQQEFEIWIEE